MKPGDPRLLLAALVLCSCAEEQEAHNPTSADVPPAATFSIVARDPATGELGIGVASKLVGVGAIVPYAKAGVGAVATQSWANPTYGPEALRRLEEGETPVQILQQFAETDPQTAERQVGIVSASGASAAHTGKGCMEFALDHTEDGLSVQGNLLADEKVVPAMVAAFKGAGEGHLADRILAALDAAEEAGGDRRGKQSAALLIVRKNWGYSGLNDRFRDIRVDDNEEPVQELRRILEIHRRTFRRPAVDE